MVSIVGLFALAFAWPVFGADIDLKSATVVPVSGATRPEQKAAQMLVEEVEKRTQIRMPQGASGKPVIRLLRAAAGGKAEGYRLRTTPTEIVIEGNDSRGVLFGVGHFLRLARMSRQSFSIAAGVNIETAPQTGLRGHQLGYRPKTNSYDAWTLPMWEQYIRELAVFGTNAIELIPPRSDDDDDSPHFPLPKIDTMAGMSKIIDDYGLDVWIWYPALDADYSKPETVEFALKEWAEVFRRLPRIDHVFVPGGDPGHTSPQYLMPLLEKQTANLRKYHPKAKMWVAPQGFSQEWLDEFIGMLRKEPAWLEGIVFGPQNRVSLPKLREMVPKRFPIRHYPDITHTIRAQYPVPEWDVAYALTLGREPVNPRPHDMRAIFRLLQSYTNGFLTYSEGCNDDVNKIVWSALGWNRDADLMSVLREYSQFFIGPEFRDGFAQGLLALEQNWRGPLLGNASVNATLEQFQAMERTATPQQLLNWRFQQGLYRAYYDAYIRARLIHETEGGGAAPMKHRAATASRAFPSQSAPDEAAAHFP
ncbi:MAG: glycoside hydrolase family 20 zincin-like fold domain-containing protein [Bryobacteraceae bacterium]